MHRQCQSPGWLVLPQNQANATQVPLVYTDRPGTQGVLQVVFTCGPHQQHGDLTVRLPIKARCVPLILTIEAQQLIENVRQCAAVSCVSLWVALWCSALQAHTFCAKQLGIENDDQ